MSENNKKPLWVSISWILLGLSNIETRKGAMILFWAFVACSFLCVPVSVYIKDWSWVGMIFLIDDWSWAGMMFPITLWLWMCIKWGDKNAVWKTVS